MSQSIDTRRPVTARDVARLAGVSQSAVSRAFTPGTSVAPQTRERIEQAAAELGYRPNRLARSLITSRSNLIGVVVPGLDNPFYAAVVEQLGLAFEPLGYRLLLFSLHDRDRSDPVLAEVLSYRVGALVLVSAQLSSRLAVECRAIDLPVVQLNRRVDDGDIPSVTSDNRQGAEAIAAFLLAGGHRRIGFIAGDPSSSTSRDREAAFVEALARQGMSCMARETGHFTFDGGARAARRMLGAHPGVEAIFCANDMMALAALGVAGSEFGRRPGSDLSIVGYDDIAPAGWPSFGLTTYIQPVVKMVQQAAEILCRQLDDPDAEVADCVVKGRLIVRDSARLPPAGLVERDGERVWQAPADGVR